MGIGILNVSSERAAGAGHNLVAKPAAPKFVRSNECPLPNVCF